MTCLKDRRIFFALVREEILVLSVYPEQLHIFFSVLCGMTWTNDLDGKFVIFDKTVWTIRNGICIDTYCLSTDISLLRILFLFETAQMWEFCLN